MRLSRRYTVGSFGLRTDTTQCFSPVLWICTHNSVFFPGVMGEPYISLLPSFPGTRPTSCRQSTCGNCFLRIISEAIMMLHVSHCPDRIIHCFFFFLHNLFTIFRLQSHELPFGDSWRRGRYNMSSHGHSHLTSGLYMMIL